MFLSQDSIAPVHDNSRHGRCRNFVNLCPDFLLAARFFIPGFLA
jgi:hypothetical protein